MAYNRDMKSKITKKDARKIMEFYSTLVVLGIDDLDGFLSAMMLVEDYVGIYPSYTSTWGSYLHMYDLLDDDDD